MVLYAGFDAEPSVLVMESMRKELEAVMSPIGVHFEWRSLSNVHSDELAVELAVINFKGHCDLSAITLRPHDGSLGLTHVSEGVILPFSDLDCDRIRSFIQRDLMMERANEREKIFGRAIARVLAHELYHIFANTRKHTARGIGKSTYLAQELVSGDLHFEERDWIALLNGKVIANLENATGAAKGALSPIEPSSR